MIYNFRNHSIDFTPALPTLMGIINMTPDSFHDGGEYSTNDQALIRAEMMIANGAKILDIGGESTRPDAVPVPLEEELRRVVPVVEMLVKRCAGEAIISVDTLKPEVAAAVLDCGADIINDVSGLSDEMLAVLVKHNCPCYILTDPGYELEDGYDDTEMNLSLLPDMLDRFKKKVNLLQNAGISQIIIDPGFGFHKTMADNYYLLNNLDFFSRLGLPILAGISHKSMIRKVLPVAAESLGATLVLNTIAVQKGASLLRVHDVPEHQNANAVLEALQKYN